MSPAYQQSTGTDLYRRSLYSVWKRTAPLPNMLAFDAPTREVCTVARGRTNTPLQALVLLNDVQFVEAARALGDLRVPNAHGPRAHKSTKPFCASPADIPMPTELALLTDLYNEQAALFADAAAARRHRNSSPSANRSPNRSSLRPNLAALTVTCQAILNLDATIFER